MNGSSKRYNSKNVKEECIDNEVGLGINNSSFCCFFPPAVTCLFQNIVKNKIVRDIVMAVMMY